MHPVYAKESKLHILKNSPGSVVALLRTWRVMWLSSDNIWGLIYTPCSLAADDWLCEILCLFRFIIIAGFHYTTGYDRRGFALSGDRVASRLLSPDRSSSARYVRDPVWSRTSKWALYGPDSSHQHLFQKITGPNWRTSRCSRPTSW